MSRILTGIGLVAGLSPLLLQVVSDSHADVSTLLLGNLAVTCLAAAGAIFARALSRNRIADMVPWLACGALIGACPLVSLRIAPYVVVATSAFALVAAGSGVGGLRSLLTGACCVPIAALVNFALLWPLTLGGYRPIDPAPYLSLDLRAHALTAGVPLHDVWVAHLVGGGIGRTMPDVDEAIAAGVSGDETVALVAAIAAYGVIARLLGLASEECIDTLSSVKRGLTDADRERSLYPAGRGAFVYQFEREAVLEIQTCVAHAVYAFALERVEGGYALYWGVYARQVNRVTPFYMSIIDPLRRLVIYPSMLRRIEHRWRARWRTDREEALTVSGDPGSTDGSAGPGAW